MKDRLENKSVLLLVMESEAEEKRAFVAAVTLVCATVLACAVFYSACKWSGNLWKTGTELPVAPYSIDEETGEVLK